MMFGLTRQYLLAIVPLAGYGFGWFLDNKETERMTMFRDKSALYGRVLEEGEKPSWP
ncbi:NADH dehydrogenase [ubiquinone] 1 beta subcomplex subunit 1 [Culex pipiens pallens]|uniref:NADH dehydrogenase [ubiquinone] 1 beta subcomplex subunit 1 n=1 Tax=Culex pipiens pallens TaxID=42434 RepID=UPI001952F9FA|nr:NADH dehydrogenase [ubiquinone] 1 beta subcomplex subunit 1 [Culex pipiens pallens]